MWVDHIARPDHHGPIMICGLLLWLPSKVLRHFLSPVTDMLDNLAEMTNEEIDRQIQELKL